MAGRASRTRHGQSQVDAGRTLRGGYEHVPTSSRPTRSPPPCAVAEPAIDPEGVLSPGVLIDP